jgi:hypothetical protein
MKFFAVILLGASVSFAADLSTGQAARLLIGQKTFTVEEEGASATLLGAAAGLALANNTLVVADSNHIGATPVNNRVLVYRNLSSMIPKPTDILPQGSRCPACVGAASLVLGQADFTLSDYELPPSAISMRAPTAVATDGVRLAVADTDNNRVLIWNTIPSSNQTPADVVVGQPDFKTSSALRPPTASSLRGPQGVWIQNGMLIVADTHNNRVLIWKQLPTANGLAADIVLGQPGFTTLPTTEPAVAYASIRADTLFSPVAATSDGQRLIVTDLGYDRVLIWDAIPTTNQKPADHVVGQLNMTTAGPNNVSTMCESNGTDTDGNPTYPARCATTLDTPRFALSDGKWLFIADGGNDRVLIYKRIPSTDGAAADTVLGQQTMFENVSGSNAIASAQGRADSMRTPSSLAWDGTDLYVADTYNRRIMVFSMAEFGIPYTGVRNSASRSIHSVGSFGVSGTIQADDEVTVKIGGDGDDDDEDDDGAIEYTYTVKENDTLANVVNEIAALINAGNGDPLVYAMPNTNQLTVILTAKVEGVAGDEIQLLVTTSEDAAITVSVGAQTLSGGADAALIAPGTLVMVIGEGLSSQVATASLAEHNLPRELGKVQFYIDGIQAPLLYVSPTQINAQMPFEVADTTSVSAYARVEWPDGHVTVTNPVGVPIGPVNPGIFAYEGAEPRAAVALHYSDSATATVSIDGTAIGGEKTRLSIEDREYSYTVQEADTLEAIRDGLIALVNQDPKVTAFSSGVWTRIRLKARVPGPEGNGIAISTSSGASGSASVTLFNQKLCCANVAGSLVTQSNPAVPGETILVYATGLGIIEPDPAYAAMKTGEQYGGPALNRPVEFVSGMAGSSTAQILYSGMVPGTFGLYEIHVELNAGQANNSYTQLWIGQDVYISNIATVPVFNPFPE